MTATPDEFIGSTTTTSTHISNPRILRILRLIWIVTALVLISVFVAALPNEFLYLRDSQRWGLGYQTALTELGLTRDFFATCFTALFVLVIIAATAVGIFIFLKRPDDWMALLLSISMIIVGTSVTPATTDLNPLLGTSFRLTGYFLFMVLLWVFPDGRVIPRWMRWLIPVAVLVCIAATPVAAELSWENTSLALGDVIFLMGTITCIMLSGMAAQIYRFRRVSMPVQRQQTKWVVLGFGMALAGNIVLLASQLFFPSLRFPLMSVQDVIYSRSSLLAILIGMSLYYISVVFIPLATISLSIIRYGLWNVDIVINRSLVYGSVTLLMAVVFGGIIALVAAIVPGQGTLVGVIIAAVVAGALFNPSRKRAQRFVDRRIYGLNFDLNQLAQAQKSPDIKNPGALSGRKIGNYEVLDVIGKGGMGEVYKAQGNGQTVALKILPDNLAQEEHFRQRFEREGQALTALHHPNIVKMFASGTSDGVAYLAMEYLEGDELGKKIKHEGALSLDDTHDILKGLAAALDYAHGRGLVHRDIKPSNVMLRKSKDGETWDAVLMDFGVAKIREAQTGLTGTGAIGTIDYMAPEQIMSAREVDRRADVYALGVMAYEMLTGVCPFKGSAAQVMFAHLQQPPPDPRDVTESVTREAAHAVMQAMAKKPDERFSTAGEFAAALG